MSVLRTIIETKADGKGIEIIISIEKKDKNLVFCERTIPIRIRFRNYK